MATHVRAFRRRESAELARKLMLTSILALVQPGSATQVTVGCLVAFLYLLLSLRHAPYAEAGVNTVGALAQINLFVYLFVGLLLKVHIDGAGPDARAFSVIVGVLSVLPIALPVLIKLSALVRRDAELGEAGDVE